VRFLFIDGHYYAYRSYFAIRELSNSRGEPTNAVFGFVKATRKMLKELAPNGAAVVWDEGLPKRRTELQPEYKQTRAEMPEPMRPQLDVIQQLVALMGLENIRLPDTEADDIMAAYAVQGAAQGHEVLLATNDKDLFQLVSSRVLIYSTAKADLPGPQETFALLGPESVVAKWGVTPGQLGDLLALVGDSADNIPGVPGLGPKGAAKLLASGPDLDAVLSSPPPPDCAKQHEKAVAARDQIRANREMIRLDTDMPLPVPFTGLGIRPRWPELVSALERCEFRTLTAEVRAEMAGATPVQGDFFS
jgi:DNA polymerase-1